MEFVLALIMSVHLFVGVVLLALPLTIQEITFLLCSPIRFASSALFNLVCFVFDPPKPTYLVVVSVSFCFSLIAWFWYSFRSRCWTNHNCFFFGRSFSPCFFCWYWYISNSFNSFRFDAVSLNAFFLFEPLFRVSVFVSWSFSPLLSTSLCSSQFSFNGLWSLLFPSLPEVDSWWSHSLRGPIWHSSPCGHHCTSQSHTDWDQAWRWVGCRMWLMIAPKYQMIIWRIVLHFLFQDMTLLFHHLSLHLPDTRHLLL